MCYILYCICIFAIVYTVSNTIQLYSTYHSSLREILTQFKIETPQYNSFDWRLDIQIASRSLHKTVKPIFLCQMSTILKKENELDKIDNLNLNNNNDNSIDDDSKTDNDNEYININDDDSSNNDDKKKINNIDNIMFECDYANLDNMINKYS